MPIYEYECQSGHVSEHYQPSSSSAPPEECPTCGKRREMQRVVSAPAPPRFGGLEGKIRTDAMIRERSDRYHKSKKGQEEHRANIHAARKRGLPA